MVIHLDLAITDISMDLLGPFLHTPDGFDSLSWYCRERFQFSDSRKPEKNCFCFL